MPSAIELRHPASASRLGRHLRLAGRCPNNSSLFPPLAAVVVVALWPYSAEELFFSQFWKICGFSRIAFSREGSWKGTAATNFTVLALSVTCGDSSPKGRAFGITVQFPVKVQSLRQRQRLPLRGSWQSRQALTEGVRRPLGGAGCERSEQTEGVQKRGLHLAVQTS